MGKVKKILNSCIIAFSMYSKIPMPDCKWSDSNMAYAMCFWPWVGGIIGLVTSAWTYLARPLGVNMYFFSVVWILIPALLTGGIHLDGLLDTADAMSSWQPVERRLEILKDSNSGAFAVITCTLYFLIYTAAVSQASQEILQVGALGFVLSRSLSAYAIVTFPKARKNGTVAIFSKGAARGIVQKTVILYAIAGAAVMIMISPIYGLAALTGGGMVFCYYHYMAMKYFRGTTGDLAGWFLSMFEMVVVLLPVIVSLCLQAI